MSNLPISLADVAYMVERFCEWLQENKDDEVSLGEWLNGEIQGGEIEITLKESVDKRIRFKTYLDGAIPAAKDMRDMWANRVKALDRALEWWKNDTKFVLENSTCAQFKGSLGTLKLQNNSVRSLEVDIPKTSVTISNVIGEIGTEFSWVDPRFTRTIAYKALNIDAIKMALEAGEVIPWARLEQGQHVRIGASHVRKSTTSDKTRFSVPLASAPGLADHEGDGRDACGNGVLT